MSNAKDIEQVMWGKTQLVTVPSGRQFIIRETNGEDDDILSNPINAKDQTNLDHFLTGVVLNEVTEGREIPFTFDDASKLLLRDRVILLISSRIHSLGSNLNFIYNFGDDPVTGGRYKYTDDLKHYLWDYSSSPTPELGDENYNRHIVPSYPKNAYEKVEIKLQSGKTVRFNLMNVEGYRWYLKLDQDQVTQNAELKARNIELHTDEKGWVTVQNFSMFSGLDMRQIRSKVQEIDDIYIPVTEITHPKTGQKLDYPLFNTPDFFYPVEI